MTWIADAVGYTAYQQLQEIRTSLAEISGRFGQSSRATEYLSSLVVCRKNPNNESFYALGLILHTDGSYDIKSVPLATAEQAAGINRLLLQKVLDNRAIDMSGPLWPMCEISNRFYEEELKEGPVKILMKRINTEKETYSAVLNKSEQIYAALVRNPACMLQVAYEQMENIHAVDQQYLEAHGRIADLFQQADGAVLSALRVYTRRRNIAIAVVTGAVIAVTAGITHYIDGKLEK